MIIENQIDVNKFKCNLNSEKKKTRKQDNTSDLIEKFFKKENILKSKNDRIYLSMIQVPKCGLCHSLIVSAEDLDSYTYCIHCSRFFHLKCTDSVNLLKNKCKLCEFKYFLLILEKKIYAINAKLL